MIKIPPSFTPTGTAFCTAHNTVIAHTDSQTRAPQEQATAARPHIDVPSPVDGDEEAILAHIFTPAVSLNNLCVCPRVCVCVCVHATAHKTDQQLMALNINVGFNTQQPYSMFYPAIALFFVTCLMRHKCLPFIRPSRTWKELF